MQHINILVGPNNCGKSTILSAFRALMAGLRRARAKGPEWVSGSKGDLLGYIVPEEALPLSIENVHTNYSELDTNVVFRLSNGNKLILFFSKDGGCVLLTESTGRAIRTPSDFKNAYPISIGVVPVLGPVEHEETLLQIETVKRDMATHRASRHFRNYWHHFPDGFEVFSELVSKTWPGMEIQKPTRADLLTGKLTMFCLENRISRELYWAGFGFQIWCQLLTHITNSRESSLLIIDEPEIYLHPDVQRQLLNILRELGPDILIATHSTEIMGDADPSEILLVDKLRQSAQRLRDIEGVQAALDAVGSVQNITLTQLARNKRILFVESFDDYKILRRFARLLRLAELSAGTDITPVESGGFSSWDKITAFAWGIGKAVGSIMHIAAIFDRDYRSQEEVDHILSELTKHIEFAHIHQRKEIENYLLVPAVLDRAVSKALLERDRRTGSKTVLSETASVILKRITNRLRSQIQGQYISFRAAHLHHSKRDNATITSQTIEIFDEKWKEIYSRMEIVPGKEVLRLFRNEIQAKYSVNITDYRIIDEFKQEEVPQDIIDLLSRLETFRQA